MRITQAELTSSDSSFFGAFSASSSSSLITKFLSRNERHSSSSVTEMLRSLKMLLC